MRYRLFATNFPHFNCLVPGLVPFPPLLAVSSQCSYGACTSHSLFLVLNTLTPNLLSLQDTGNDILLITTALRDLLGTSLRYSIFPSFHFSPYLSGPPHDESPLGGWRSCWPTHDDLPVPPYGHVPEYPKWLCPNLANSACQPAERHF